MDSLVDPEPAQRLTSSIDLARGTQALDGVSLSVASGEILGVTGPSGAGKSTLCRIVAGVQAPSRGEVCLDGQRVTGVPPERRRIAIMFE